MPTLSYRMITTQFSEQQWNTAIRPAIRATCNAAGMAKNIAHAIFYGPLEYQGVGVQNPYILQGIILITTFLNEGPLNELNSNVISLSRTNDGDPLPMESNWCSFDDLHFTDTPFERTYTKSVRIKRVTITSQKNCFGFVLCTDEVNERVFIFDILPRSDAAKTIGSSKTAKNKAIGS